MTRTPSFTRASNAGSLSGILIGIAVTKRTVRALGRLRCRSLLARGCLFLLLHRPAVQALRTHIAIDELDHRHGRGITIADAGLEDPAIAPLARPISVGQRAEQLGYDHIVPQLRIRETTRVHAAALAQRNQLL